MEFKKGFARPIKKVLGVLLLASGLSLIIIPDVIVPILCGQKALFGLVMVASGYFLIISGRRIE